MNITAIENDGSSTSKQKSKSCSLKHSLRNEEYELENLLFTTNINVVALSETHLGDSLNNEELRIDGYNLLRNDRNKYGGEGAFFLHSLYRSSKNQRRHYVS
ncbi:hypothetical protein XENOCAPTIV_020956 [Xenoophorus captivus]|uniref:Uncharacterized protein n=1 Tax=Xenoophorus captivus TaxID=1517983 RepID=A0ABV0SGD8_9TELE